MVCVCVCFLRNLGASNSGAKRKQMRLAPHLCGGRASPRGETERPRRGWDGCQGWSSRGTDGRMAWGRCNAWQLSLGLDWRLKVRDVMRRWRGRSRLHGRWATTSLRTSPEKPRGDQTRRRAPRSPRLDFAEEQQFGVPSEGG